MTKIFFQDNKKTGLVIPEDFNYSKFKGSVLALGYFDGMHLGHQKVFSEMRAYAKKYHTTAIAQTFSDTPKSKTMQSAGRGLLTTIEEKYELMRKFGADAVVFFPFSEYFSSLSAQDYLKHYINELFAPKAIVVGHDYRFGAGRQGDVEMLQSWGQNHGVDVKVISPEIYRDRVVSSSWVRECIMSADLDTAKIMLGRMMSYSGKVVFGQQLGRKLGFPTANIIPEEEKITPPHGVYVSFIKTEKGLFEAVTNIGTRPTVLSSDSPPHCVVETVVLDQKMNLYDVNITVFLAKMIRKEKRFDDLESLRHQINEDVIKARNDHDLNRQEYASFFSMVL